MSSRAVHPSPRPRLGAALLALALALFVGVIATVSLGRASLVTGARASEASVGTLYATSGLTWADVSPDTTPNLACFSEHSGVAGMSLTSTSVMPTKRQGLASLATGDRTSALASPGAAPASTDSGKAPALPGGARLVLLPDVAAARTATPAQHEASLRALDTAFAKDAGPCGSTHAKKKERVIVASVGALNPTGAEAYRVEHTRAYNALPAALNLQVYADSGFGPGVLTSPSTRQAGTVLSIDIAATLAGKDQLGTGRHITGAPASAGVSPVREARDMSVRSRLTEDSLGIVFGALVAALAAAAAAAWAFARSAAWRDSLLARASRAVLTTGILAIPVGLTSSILPSSVLSPAPLALVAYTVLGTALTGTLVYAGSRLLRPSRPLLPVAATALIAVAAILTDSFFGSRAQFTSILGNQPIYGGRFYGLTNHLTGILLAAWALGCGLLIHALGLTGASHRERLARLALVGGTGALVGAVSIMPAMGADAGSALIYAPVTLVACLAISGVRMRWWHLLVALAGGALVFVAAALADYARPASGRTHLGEFAARVIDARDPAGAVGTFWAVFADRTVRMLEPLWLYSPLIMVPAALVIAALTVLAVRRGPFATKHPHFWAIRLTALMGAWIGAATNDTGLVLVGLAYLFGAVLSVAAWAQQATRPR